MDDFQLHQLKNKASPFPPRTGTDGHTLSPVEDLAQIFQSWTYNLPYFQLEDELYAQCLSHELFVFDLIISRGYFSHL